MKTFIRFHLQGTRYQSIELFDTSYRPRFALYPLARGKTLKRRSIRPTETSAGVFWIERNTEFPIYIVGKLSIYRNIEVARCRIERAFCTAFFDTAKIHPPLFPNVSESVSGVREGLSIFFHQSNPIPTNPPED